MRHRHLLLGVFLMFLCSSNDATAEPDDGTIRLVKSVFGPRAKLTFSPSGEIRRISGLALQLPDNDSAKVAMALDVLEPIVTPTLIESLQTRLTTGKVNRAGTRHSVHLSSQLYLDQIPILDAFLTIEVSKSGTARALGISGPGFRTVKIPLQSVEDGKLSVVACESAKESAQAVACPKNGPRTVWYATDGVLRLGALFYAGSPTLTNAWEILLDRETGNVVFMRDRALHFGGDVTR